MKNAKFIRCIEDVIASIDSRYINYDPTRAKSCNVGLIVQSLLSFTEDRLSGHLYSCWSSERGKEWQSWLRWTKENWPMGHTPNWSILLKLYKLGFDREDIGHITYLNSERVLREAKMGMSKKQKYTTKTELKRVPVYHDIHKTDTIHRKDWWGRLWGLQTTKEWTEQVQIDWDYKDVEVKVPDGEAEEVFDAKSIDHTNLENFHKYLKAWVKLLKSDLDEQD